MLEYEWLRHLENSIPKSINSDRITPYTVALEGWRRGLTLKYYTAESNDQVFIHFSLSYGCKEVKFARSTGPNLTLEARKICKNKLLTKDYLEKAFIPVPKGKVFRKPVDQEEILNYAESINYPVVLKPIDGKMGRGVIPNIMNSDDLIKALKYVHKDLGYNNIIIEKHAFGNEYRVYVVNGKVIGAINRIPAYIIGDGTSSIRKLIQRKNIQRRNTPSLRSRPIKIDSEVKKYITQAGYTLDSVLEKNKYLTIRKNSNVSSGGDPVDVTDELSEGIKQIAIDATRAIPDLPISGVDIIVDNTNDTGKVIELNTAPGIASHLFPLKGKARNIPKAIIDYYFPETISQYNRVSSKFYFDYPKIEKLIQLYVVKEVKLPNVPKGDLNFKSYIIQGRVQGVNYRRWIKKNAVDLGMNGFAENRKDGSVFIVVAGILETIEQFHTLIHQTAPRRAKVENIKEVEWNKPIKVGFEITRQK